MNRIISILVAGALVGTTLTSWISPKIIAWYFEPPVEIGVNCRPATEWAMHALQTMQGIGLLAGSAIAGLGYFLIARKKK
jgi:Na+/phosphate symporter